MAGRTVVIRSLKALRTAEAGCTRCPLYRHATQVAPSEGPARALLMMVGEQPGDQEDRQGQPSSGRPVAFWPRRSRTPASTATRFSSPTRSSISNSSRVASVRLHKRPNAYEIDQCHFWLAFERKLVKPQLIVALGATAVRSVSGKPIAIGKIRGRVMPLEDGGRMLATTHPSAILRAPDAGDRHALFRRFVADLKVGVRMLAKQA